MPITRAIDEHLKALLEGISLKSGQEETGEMQKGLDDTKNELKERMEKGQEETKQEMQKGLENVQKCREELKNSLEEKINSVQDRIAGKMRDRSC
ncbi:hypothetical protein TNCV_627841 [Trichonephila clavipes]|nr:hypothetical protein TNCV_627841 [Trichonephila clavipes]